MFNWLFKWKQQCNHRDLIKIDACCLDDDDYAIYCKECKTIFVSLDSLNLGKSIIKEWYSSVLERPVVKIADLNKLEGVNDEDG